MADSGAESATKSELRAAFLLELFVGGSMGFLLGVLVGMSAAPVVANLIAAVTAAALSLVGLRGSLTTKRGSASKKADSPIELAQPNLGRARVGGFALFAVIGLVIGLIVRTHDLFSPPLAERIALWRNAGYSAEEARAIVLFQDAKLMPTDWKFVKEAGSATQKSLLYASSSTVCGETNPTNFRDATTTLKSWENEGGIWKAAGAVIQSHIPQEQQSQAVKEFHDAVCSHPDQH